MTKYWVFSCGVQALTLTYREIRDVSAELLTVLHNGVDYGLTSISTIGPYTDSLEVIMVSPLEEPLGYPAAVSGLSIAILRGTRSSERPQLASLKTLRRQRPSYIGQAV